MRKPTFCIWENNEADQLCSNYKADQCLCFHYMDSTIPLLSKFPNFKLLAIFCYCIDRFVSDLFRNHFVVFLMTWLKLMEAIYLIISVMHFLILPNNWGKNLEIYTSVRY